MRLHEGAEYQRAAAEYAAHPGDSNSITTMMRLALEGISPQVKQLAGHWLNRMLGVLVVEDEVQHAVEAAPARLC